MIFFLLAQAQPAAPAASPLPTYVMMACMFAIFYFLLIRPQQKRQKEHRLLLSNLKTGDKIVTSGGIHGLIANVKDNTFVVKIADNVKIEVDKSAVTSVVKATDEPKPV